VIRPASSRNTLALALAGAALAAGLTIGLLPPGQPVDAAGLTVFDPANYSQNILTAARTLQQVNNQIRSLQNQARGLINQAKNLSRIGFPELDAIRQTIREIDTLMGEAQGIRFQVSDLDTRFRQLFPRDLSAALSTNDQVIAARGRLDTAFSAYQHTMTVQARVVESVQADAGTLNAIVAKSQDAEGALQASQATNQLLALAAKQQFQIQNLMAAQYRAEAIEKARRAQAEADAHTATTKFLGTGTAYTPH
jgi:type IV secretion system protein TrbJ